MGIPFRRTSKTRKRKRRSHLSLSKPQLNECKNCSSKKMTHTACPECGFYKGKQEIETKK